MDCKICSSTTKLFGTARILRKYEASFYRCDLCGFMQTEDPYWLDESYSKTITTSDIGLISRNLTLAQTTKKIILTFHQSNGQFIDYGGGYGMFVRLMRDAGYDFYRYDPMCENLFSAGFEASSGTRYDLLTAWEVFEHLVDPLADIEKMASFSDEILFSTQLLPIDPPPLGDWWYYGLEHGQHVSFYTRPALELIAQKFGMQLAYSKGALHWFRKKTVSRWSVRAVLAVSYPWLKLLMYRRAPVSLMQKDFEKLTGIPLK